MSVRSRDRILANLEAIYREAYGRAKESGDAERMMDLDASYQREQLMLEVLLDVRDALCDSQAESPSHVALEKLKALGKIAKLGK
ncbi:MAG: hypothetical protein ACE5HT_02145 [Gemmatimonadales bacterium]